MERIGIKLQTEEFKRFIIAMDKEEKKELRAFVTKEVGKIRTSVRRAYRIHYRVRTGNLWKSFKSKVLTRLLRYGVFSANVASFYYTSLWLERGWDLTTHGKRAARRTIRHIPGKRLLEERVNRARPGFISRLETRIQASIEKAKRSR